MHPLVNYSDTEESGYAAQIHHTAGNSVNSYTPGAAFLFMAVRQRQGELCARASASHIWKAKLNLTTARVARKIHVYLWSQRRMLLRIQSTGVIILYITVRIAAFCQMFLDSDHCTFGSMQVLSIRTGSPTTPKCAASDVSVSSQNPSSPFALRRRKPTSYTGSLVRNSI